MRARRSETPKAGDGSETSCWGGPRGKGKGGRMLVGQVGRDEACTGRMRHDDP